MDMTTKPELVRPWPKPSEVHDKYGPCDALDGGECSMCGEILENLREQLEAAERSAREMHIAADNFRAENARLRAAIQSVLKAHAEWERACEQDSNRADDAWYDLHEAIEHDLTSACQT